MKYLSWLLASLITVLLYPLLIIFSHYWRQHERDVLTPYRCDGDLIAFEVNGHNVEMFRWIKWN
jgi:hypothetical protein